MSGQEVMTALRRARCELADRIEATKASMLALVTRNPLRPDRALDREARRLGDRRVPELTSRLRAAADGHFRVMGSPTAASLGDLLVRGADILRPCGQEFDASPREVVPILDAYSGLFGRLAFHAAPGRGRRLAATDADWSKGKGDEINGRAIDLMLLLANRRQVKPWLEGSGVAGV